MSKLHDKLYCLLVGCAETGDPCPTNPAMALMVGCTPSTASWLVSTLGLRRQIVVERRDRRRRIVILRTGKATEWSTSTFGGGPGMNYAPPTMTGDFAEAMRGRRFENARTKGEITRAGPKSPPRDYSLVGCSMDYAG